MVAKREATKSSSAHNIAKCCTLTSLLYCTVVVQADLFNEVHPNPSFPEGAPYWQEDAGRTRRTTSGVQPSGAHRRAYLGCTTEVFPVHTQCTVQSTQCTVRSTRENKAYNFRSATVRCAQNRLPGATEGVHSAQCTGHRRQDTVPRTQYTVQNVQCPEHSTRCTIHRDW